MIVTGGFMCDAMNTADGKFNVLGGVWDWCVVPVLGHDDHVVIINLVALIQAEREDDSRATVKVDLLSPGQEVVLRATVEAELPAGTVQGFVMTSLPLRFSEYGKHVFLISGSSGEPYAMPLDVRPA
ncbi:MAG: hypothetical protein ABIQ09_16065 [Jatrophihabitantaceae bacterium]